MQKYVPFPSCICQVGDERLIIERLLKYTAQSSGLGALAPWTVGVDGLISRANGGRLGLLRHSYRRCVLAKKETRRGVKGGMKNGVIGRAVCPETLTLRYLSPIGRREKGERDTEEGCHVTTLFPDRSGFRLNGTVERQYPMNESPK